MAKKQTIVSVPIETIEIWYDMNPRTKGKTKEEAAQKLHSPDVLSSLIAKGQKHPLNVLRGDAKYDAIGASDSTKLYAMVGNRRLFNMLQYNAECIKTGREPYFPEVMVIVYDDLDLPQIVDIVNDHGSLNLDSAQCFAAFENEYAPGRTIKDIANVLRPILETSNLGLKALDTSDGRTYDPMTEKGRDEYLTARKGTLDIWSLVCQSPKVLRDLFIKKLEGKSKVPRNGDVQTLYRLHSEDIKESIKNGNQVSRSNPGPKFLAKFNDLLAKAQEAAEDGESRPKSISTFNRETMKDIYGQAESRVIKAVMLMSQREAKWSENDLRQVDAAAVAFEKGNVQEGTKILDDVWSSKIEVTSEIKVA